MRSFQIIVLILAFLVFIVALFFQGTDTGLTLWYAGVAVLLLDVVCCLIWPTAPRR
jgi:hypothetical protein